MSKLLARPLFLVFLASVATAPMLRADDEDPVPPAPPVPAQVQEPVVVEGKVPVDDEAQVDAPAVPGDDKAAADNKGSAFVELKDDALTKGGHGCDGKVTPMLGHGWKDNRKSHGLDHVQAGNCSCQKSDEACGCGKGSWGDACGGLLVPSDHCFSDFISPMTNPVYFEDPRTLTELRFIYLRHRVPMTAAGGEVELVAMQIRAALTDRLSIIATKDGFITSSNPLIDDGWADINVGLKMNLLTDECAGRLLSGGVTYELPIGSTQTLQGNGDGLFHVFLTGGTRVGNGHIVSATGFLLPADTVDESQIWYWSTHFDGQLGNSGLYWLAEVNWYHWLQAGEQTSVKGVPLTGIEGGDLFNLGLAGVAGNDIVTGAVGVKYKPSQHLELGVAWEAPLTERRDVLDNRLTVDCILRY